MLNQMQQILSCTYVAVYRQSNNLGKAILMLALSVWAYLRFGMSSRQPTDRRSEFNFQSQAVKAF